MALGNLTVNSHDIALLSIWLLIALFWNVRAFVMIASLSIYTVTQAVTATDFQAFIICSMLYFWICTTNIINQKEFLQAFTAFGTVYFIGAIDHFTYSHLHYDTKFDVNQPYFIVAINAYVLAYLISGGRRDNAVGFINDCAKLLLWFKLHLLPSKKNK